MVMTVEEKKVARKASVAKYYAKNKAKMKIASDKWKENNQDKWDKIKKDYYAKNKEKLLNATKKWQKTNKPKVAIIAAKHKAKSKVKYNAESAIKRAKKFGATIYMTKEDKANIAELYTIARDASELFGYGWDVDHIVPLAKGGLHKLSNLQVVPSSWNRAKKDNNCNTYWD